MADQGLAGRIIAATFGFILGLASAAGAVAQEITVTIEPAFPALGFDRPVALLQAPGDNGRWYLVEQRGVVLTFENDPAAEDAAVFVDLRDRVDDGPSEAGLLGMAFHPDFQDNGQVFLSYTGSGSPLVSRISRFIVNGGAIDPGSETVILAVDQPYSNHNGGQIAFGPDGYLYIGFGDGGAGGDPHGHGQNTETLLGAMLRIDVDGGDPYGIPPDNPFADGGGRPEIYAWGLRNPWRWSFDRETGELWVADVGQNRWEEIDRVERGGNYGWNLREGSHCYRAAECPSEGLIGPVAEYSHDEGCSVTGGYVVRGDALPALDAVYLYGDYCSGRVWGLFPGDDGGFVVRQLLETGLGIGSFAEGADGTIYILDHLDGGIHRLVAGAG